MALRLAHLRLSESEKAYAVSAMTLAEVRRLPPKLRRYRRRIALNINQRRYNLKLHIYGTWLGHNTERRAELHRQAVARYKERHRERVLECLRRRRRKLTKRYGACSAWAHHLDKLLRGEVNNKAKERLLKYVDRLLLESKLQKRNTRRALIPVPKIVELRILARKNGSLDMRYLPSEIRASRSRSQGHGKEV